VSLARPTLRIATYNIHRCRGLDGRTRPERTAAVLREINADVLSGSTTRVGQIVDMPSGATANIAAWKVAGVDKVYITSGGAIFSTQFNATSGYLTNINDAGSGNNCRMVMGGAAKHITYNTNNVDRCRVDASGMWLFGTTHSFGLGDPSTDGSWRLAVSGADLLIQKRVTGAWQTKSTIIGA
jgi:hypothetical protein